MSSSLIRCPAALPRPGGSYGGAPYTPAGYTSYAPGGVYGPAYGAQSYAPATPMYSSGYGAPAYGYAGGDAMYSTTPTSPALGWVLCSLRAMVLCLLVALARNSSPDGAFCRWVRRRLRGRLQVRRLCFYDAHRWIHGSCRAR